MPSMLTGRESLIRLVGKRRRTISPHLLQLLHSQPLCADPSSSLTGKPGSPENIPVVAGGYDTEWVTCPVCGCSIRGTDKSVNNHLDTCLTRGGKRKLTQRTLLQFSFSPRAISKTCLDDLTNLKKDFRRKLDGKSDPTNTLILGRCFTGNIRENDHVRKSSAHILSNSEIRAEDPIQNCIAEDSVSCQVVESISSSLRPENMKMIEPVASGEKDTVIIFETFIVGRRFHEDIELQLGSHLSFLRDPQNIKDNNAIKVLCADTVCPVMLGCLPRELVRHLSPLLDNQYVKCEGSVVSLPKRPLDDVPIQLACQRTITYDELDRSDQQNFEFMWENVLCVTEDMNACPHSTTKYQKNFHLMIDDVMKFHGHVFTDEEKLFIGSFNSFSNDAQRLFIQLYNRKGPWFRISSISYQEIADSQNAAEELRLAGYMHSFYSTKDPFEYDMKEILDVLTVNDLREVFNQTFSKKGMNNARRQELVNLLVSAYEDGTCSMLPEMVLQRAGICIKISSTADILMWRIQRLFFLNSDQDLSSFLLVDLGLIKFPTYTCNISRPIFQDRDDLLEYEEAVEVAQLMDQSLDENKMEMVNKCITISVTRMLDYFGKQTRSFVADSPASFFSYFTASWVYSKVLTLGVSVHEHEQRYKDATSLLKELLRRIANDRRRGYWTMRLSVDLERMGYLDESLSVAEEGVLDPWVRSGSKIALQRRVLRLCKPPRRWKTPSYAESVKRKIKENSPLDLGTDDFYVSRKSLIESQLQKIHEGLGEEILITSWEKHTGTSCKGVNWDQHSLADLRAAVSCIGGPCLASLCRHLAEDYRSWSSGMPDLLLWRFHGGETDGGEAKLVEVKGPRDRLSEQQRAWMLVLMDCGFDTEVCKVTPVPKS